MPTITSGSNTITSPNITNQGYTGYKLVSNFGGVSYLQYFQRVFCPDLDVWCYYYSVGQVNPSPSSASTSPNWVGSITNHQVLGTVSLTQVG